jgi:VCBS repeat protein
MQSLPSSLLLVRGRILPQLWAAAGIAALLAAPSPSAAAQSCTSPALGRVLDIGVAGPDLWTESGPPVVGRSFSLRVSNGVPGATGFVGWSLHHDPRPVPFASGLVHPGLPLALAPIVLDEHGNSPALLRSPPLPLEVCGVEVYVQAALVGSAPGGGVALTNALHLGVGGPNPAPFLDPKVVLPRADLAPFDMDRDGLTDLVARQFYYFPDVYTQLQEYFVLRNMGDGTFEPGPITRTNAWAAEFLVADFDGDGFGDVATAGILLTGDAKPQLTVRGTTFASGFGEPRAIGDLNGDGSLDLVGSSSSGLATSLNKEGGVFVPGSSFPIATGRVALGHFDFDRTLDAAVAHPSTPDVAVLFGNGNATFRSGTSFGTAERVFVMSARDLDGDGLDELIYGMAGEPELHVRRCVGGGVFDLPVPYPMNDAVMRLAILDLDGDGRDDLIANNESVLLGRGDGTFEPPMHYGVRVPSSASLLDVDHDGRMDVLSEDGTLHRGLAGGRLNAPRRPVAGLVAGEDIAAGDLDGDGLDDLVVPDSDGEILVVSTLERGLFAPPRSVALASGPNRVALADLDGDGDLDAAVGHSAANALSILRGDGAGALQVGTSHPVGGATSELALADLDADGVLDLIASHLAGGAGFSVALGNGDGTFRPSLTSAVTGKSLAVVAGRFLGSASVDVQILREQSSNYAVLSFAGNGDGTFATAVVTYTTHGMSFVVPRHMTAADGDLDGDPDLFISAYDGVSQYQLLWRTNANGTFTRQSRILNGVRQHAVADFSGDGLPDLVATSHGNTTFGFGLGLHFFAGTGAIDFPATGLSHYLGFRSGPLAIGDFDRNGTPDVAVVNEVSDDVWVALNHLGD